MIEKEHIFDHFIQMEVEYELFNIVDRFNFPCWDFIRTDIYGHYLRNRADVKKIEVKKSLFDKLKILFLYVYKGITLPNRCSYLFVYTPRFFDDNNRLYDRVSDDLMGFVKEKSVYINASSNRNYLGTKYKDNTLFIFDILARIKSCKVKLDRHIFDTVYDAIHNTFQIKVDYDTINYFYKRNVIDFYSYKYCLQYLSPKKVFVSRDRRKGLYHIAKQMGIPTYELQHGTVVYEYPSYSYPRTINSSSNIAFADYFVEPGEGWGKNNNIPAKKIFVLGNNNFKINSDVEVRHGNYILIISSPIHGHLLMPFAKQIAEELNIPIVYRLHPSEFKREGDVLDYFSDNNKMIKVDSHSNMQDLIKDCSLMITVSSTVYFEAKTYGKRVAVYKRDNYYTLRSYVDNSINSCLIDNIDDVKKALEMPEISQGVQFYKPFNEVMARHLVYEL